MANKSNKEMSQDLVILITSLVAIIISIIALFKQGFFGIFIDKVTRYLFGQYHAVVYILIIITSLYVMFLKKKVKITLRQKIGYLVLFTAFLLFSAAIKNHGYLGLEAIKYYVNNTGKIFNYQMLASGGFFGIVLYGLFTALFGTLGTYLFLPVIIVIGLLLTFDYKKLSQKLSRWNNDRKMARLAKEKDKQTKKTKKSKLKDLSVKKDMLDNKSSEKVESKPTLSEVTKRLSPDNVTEEKPQLVDGKAYQLPPLELLDTKIESGKSAKNKSAAQIKGDKLIDVLSDFNIKADLVDIHIGPSVTKFEIRPDSSVKVSRISSIQDNIKMELAARNIRIEAPIPGKNTVGIEIPNIETTPVKLYELLSDMPEVYDNKPLLFTLGKDLTGNIVYSDLTKMPHLLIAGATGAGKSVAMNAIITTILIRTTPQEVRLLLIDPKKVEFSAFAHIPHLITPIITEPEKANNALAKVVDLMDDRYRAFADIGVKNIAAYNDYRENHPAEKLDNLELIVVIIDELADLMLVAGKEVEMSIQRITQLARAAGIHLIVATQRPSTDVITGIIKANIPSRISFAVSSGIDSRTILDATGAERLLGNGDMLYYPVTHSAPSRLQGVFVTDEEVSKIANFVSKGPSPDHFKDFENLDENGDLAQMPMAFDDPLYEEVKMFVVREQKASTSLIQRSFGIGYNRAARIIDALEAKDIIGPMQGSKPRDVNISIDDLDSEE